MSLATFGHTIKGIIEGDSDPDTFIPALVGYYQAAGKCVKALLPPDH
jgi:Zn-dependent alcohol dehydrogenase